MGELPKTHGEMPKDFGQHILNQIGIVVGQQGYDNNVVMAEAFTKILPQTILAQQKGLLNNMYYHRENNVQYDKLSMSRLMRIWEEGLEVMVIRDLEHPETIIDREVIYPLPEQDMKIDMGGKIALLKDMWECQRPCSNCGGKKFAQLHPWELGRKYPDVDAMTICERCRIQTNVEIEEKPSFRELEPQIPRNTSPIWVWTKGKNWIKYSLDQIELIDLSSTQGGWYNVYKEGKEAKFKSYDEILNSDYKTHFPSQSYYQDTVDILFKQFLFFYHISLVDIMDIVNFKYKLVFDDPNTQDKLKAIDSSIKLN